MFIDPNYSLNSRSIKLLILIFIFVFVFDMNAKIDVSVFDFYFSLSIWFHIGIRQYPNPSARLRSESSRWLVALMAG